MPRFPAFAAFVAATLLFPADPAGSSASRAQEPTKTPRSWPMFGGTPGRNMVNLVDRNLPEDWSVEKGKLKNVKWSAELGSCSHGSPIVADGRVFVTTNNYHERPRGEGQWQGQLRAYRENDGKLLWVNRHDVPQHLESAWSFQGLPSTPTVDGKNVYYLTPSCEVVCAACEDGKILWRYNMARELKVSPGVGSFHTVPPLATPLVIGDFVFVVTGNGTDSDEKVVAPQAPSFIALHKSTGKLIWQSNLPGANIIDGQWSSPAYASVNDVPQVIFAGGDGVIYSFEPGTGKLLWKCDCLPARKKTKDTQGPPCFAATPVVVRDRLYVGMGVAGGGARPRATHFLCLDITKKGDVSLKSYDATAAENKNSALVWAYGGLAVPQIKGQRAAIFGSTVSTAAVHDGLVYAAEQNGYLHCLDAATGKRLWLHDLGDSTRSSPYVVDGRVFLAGEGGEVTIFAQGRTKRVLAKVEMDDDVNTTPVAVNGALYVATMSHLYAIARP